MKKVLTLFTALIWLGSMSFAQADDTYVVAGNETDLFGETWAGTKAENAMTWNGDRSLFIKTYTATAAISGVELKVVKNGSEWNGDFLGNNVKFNISGAGSFDVCFNTTTGIAFVEGANIVPASKYSIYAAGDGNGNWLNGESWNTGAAVNKMTEVEMNVWEITFSNVAAGNGRQIKFTVNGTWDENFGGNFSSFGAATDAASKGDNITFNMSSASDISARLDLRNCKIDKSGAKFTIANGALPDLHNCFVAGSATEIFGTPAWKSDAAANRMTWDAVAGKYSKTYTVTKAYKSVSLKAVYDGVWYGDNGENVKFSLSGAGTFTVLFDKNSKEVTVEGAIVGPEQFDFEYVTIAGNGNGNWLGGESWSTTAVANRMTEVATDIYEITFDDVPGAECQFKFSFNGGWDYEIGGVFEAFGTASAAVYGNTAGTITFTALDKTDITIRLDLSNFNFATKAGATFTVTQTLPAQYVSFEGLSAQILKGTEVTFSATSIGITNPIYTYFVKPAGGEYGIGGSSYTFDANGEYVVKVSAEGDNTIDPVIAEENVTVYDTHTFTTGTRIYVDFSAIDDDTKKGVNYPYGDKKNELDYDAAGAGTFKTIVFTADVEWTTNDVFIKTEKNGWAAQKFTVPGVGQNKVVVAADGASYTWETFAPSTYYFKNKWDNDEWSWEEAISDGTGKFRLENVIFGGNGVNYNFIANDAGAVWKDYTKIKYMDNAEAKVVSVYDTINLVLDPANDTVWAEMVKKEKVAFTVAGNRLSLFDLGWEPTHPYKYTDMKKQADGTYLWNNGGQEAVIPSGQLELKVIKNRDYANGNWPKAGNFEYNVQRSGEYEIAIHFNPYTETIWIDTVLTKLMNIQELSIKGSWDSWAAATPFVLGGNYDKSLATLSLAAGDYEFKLVDGNNKWYGDGEAFVRNDNSHRGVVAHDAGANMTIHVDKAGEYLFSYYFDGEQLKVSYPGIVPAEKIAPLSGKFTINAQGDTAVFSRGNLQYNYESGEWYAAEKQYEVLGDLNLRFGDNTYQGSVDLFGWSCASSDYGKQWKYKDGDFTGDFVDWGGLFAGDEKEWGTLSLAEWNYLLGRTKGGKQLWTMINIGPDSINGLALLPDDWSAPACANDMVYGFYNLDEEVNYKKNAFTMAEWAEMEASGVAFLPLGGARAGYYGNTWSGSAESTLSNPLASGYDWVDNENLMGYYWLSSTASATQVSTVILPGWNNNEWTAPTIWAREKRRGQSVRLVTRIPKVDFEDVRTGLSAGHYYTVCYDRTMKEIRGASLWSFIGKDASFAYIQEESAPFAAGKPYIVYAESEKLEAILEGDAVDAGALVENHGLHGTFSLMEQADLNVAGSDIYLVIGDELRRATGNGQTGNRLPAYRAYVKLDEIPDDAEPVPAPGRRVRSMPMQGQVATGIENDGLMNDGMMKVLIDGQLFLIRGEKMYDATGRLVK